MICSSLASVSACDRLSIFSTSALPKGVYGSGLNTGVSGASQAVLLCEACPPPPPPNRRGGSIRMNHLNRFPR